MHRVIFTGRIDDWQPDDLSVRNKDGGMSSDALPLMVWISSGRPSRMPGFSPSTTDTM
jgi:hypothetical protein